ncbi:MAG: hypothetical protein Q8S33_38260 [Myxococcales bacterium]|nr:hypothetical protein [Myxococcales bacterium]
MSNRTKLAVGLFSLSLMACWLPPEFVREETQLFDTAVKDRDESALKQMCRNPHIISYANGYLHGGVIGQQDKACAELKKVLAGNETDRLARAVAKGDTAVMLQMCRSPSTLDSKLTNAELGVEGLQPQACEALKKATASNFEKVTKEATSLGGVPCLVRLEKHYDELKRSKTWLTEVTTEDGQRAAMKPHTDVCLGKLEADAKDAKHVAVYRELMAAKFAPELPSLMADQNARVRSVSTALRTSIATDYEAEAAKLKDEPAAAALYLACAGKMALLAGDTARQGKDVADAKALVTKAAIKESLTVSFAGDGLAAEVIARIKADGLGSGLELATTGADIPVVVQLSTPSFQSTKEQVTLTTEVKEQKGTRTRHEWQLKSEMCATKLSFNKRAEESCARNGPRNTNCGRIASNNKDYAYCLEQLGRIKKDEPAFAMVSVPYDGTKYRGTLTGTLSIKQGADAPVEQKVVAADESVGHGSVARANLGAVSARTPTAAELKGSYLGSAKSTVMSGLRKVADGRAQTFLDSALKASSTSAMAADVVRFAVIAKKRPEGKLAAALNEKLDLPAMDGLELLLAK